VALNYSVGIKSDYNSQPNYNSEVSVRAYGYLCIYVYIHIYIVYDCIPVLQYGDGDDWLHYCHVPTVSMSPTSVVTQSLHIKNII